MLIPEEFSFQTFSWRPFFASSWSAAASSSRIWKFFFLHGKSTASRIWMFRCSTSLTSRRSLSPISHSHQSFSQRCQVGWAINVSKQYQLLKTLNHLTDTNIDFCFLKFLAVQTESVVSSIDGIVTDWLTDSLTDWPTFVFWHKRATQETGDLWDIWSQWWGNMTWPTFWQFWQFLTILTIFDRLAIFTVFENFENFGQF